MQEQLPMLLVKTLDNAGTALVLTLRNGDRIELSAQTLYDNAPACVDAISGQRRLASTDGEAVPLISDVRGDDSGFALAWNDGTASHYPWQWLEQFWLQSTLVPERVLWSATEAASMPLYDHDAFMQDDDVLECALAALWQFGFVRLAHSPLQANEVESTIARFGYVRETNYGRVFDVRIKPVTANLADSDKGLELHTDNPYRTPVPGLQILHALQTTDSGGSSVLVDGFSAVEQLRREQPDDVALLVSVPATFTWTDGTHFHSTTAPVIELDHDGNCRALRFNHRAFRCIHVSGAAAQAWRTAYRNLGRIIADERLGFRYSFKPGDMVLMDNERILHGREAYDAQSQSRWLQGAYADKDALQSTLIRLIRRSVETIVREIEALFASPSAQLHYGEAISIAGHMLQTAEVLAGQDEDAAVVVAGLLHDIGWMLDGEAGHQHTGADYLEQRFGRNVSEPVRLHVDAKRWLVATRADYHQRLSAESRRTLELQGGPLSPQECAAFEQNAFFRQAIALRLADDSGKRTDSAPRELSAYLPLIRLVALKGTCSSSWCGTTLPQSSRLASCLHPEALP